MEILLLFLLIAGFSVSSFTPQSFFPKQYTKGFFNILSFPTGAATEAHLYGKPYSIECHKEARLYIMISGKKVCDGVNNFFRKYLQQKKMVLLLFSFTHQSVLPLSKDQSTPILIDLPVST